MILRSEVSLNIEVLFVQISLSDNYFLKHHLNSLAQMEIDLRFINSTTILLFCTAKRDNEQSRKMTQKNSCSVLRWAKLREALYTKI